MEQPLEKPKFFTKGRAITWAIGAIILFAYAMFSGMSIDQLPLLPRVGIILVAIAIYTFLIWGWFFSTGYAGQLARYKDQQRNIQQSQDTSPPQSNSP